MPVFGPFSSKNSPFWPKIDDFHRNRPHFFEIGDISSKPAAKLRFGLFASPKASLLMLSLGLLRPKASLLMPSLGLPSAKSFAFDAFGQLLSAKSFAFEASLWPKQPKIGLKLRFSGLFRLLLAFSSLLELVPRSRKLSLVPSRSKTLASLGFLAPGSLRSRLT